MVVDDALSELRLARAVGELGAEEANRRENPDPFRELEYRKVSMSRS